MEHSKYEDCSEFNFYIYGSVALVFGLVIASGQIATNAVMGPAWEHDVAENPNVSTAVIKNRFNVVVATQEVEGQIDCFNDLVAYTEDKSAIYSVDCLDSNGELQSSHSYNNSWGAANKYNLTYTVD